MDILKRDFKHCKNDSLNLFNKYEQLKVDHGNEITGLKNSIKKYQLIENHERDMEQLKTDCSIEITGLKNNINRYQLITNHDKDMDNFILKTTYDDDIQKIKTVLSLICK